MTGADDDRELVGPYRVLKAIGAGGSARIDLARIDRAYGFQRHVVLKRPLEHLRGDPGVAASLRREARIGGRLRHPNLVAILDAGIHDGYDYLVLEYVHGDALRTVMHADAPGQVRDLPVAVALSIVSDAARGMHEAHELTDGDGSPLGLVHRDVSPGNILIGLDGTVKLADFGIAKETRVATLSGSLHGTVTYMAPEQCQGHAYDRRADVFSLGVILYELVTGARLFWADNDVASLHRVLSGTVPRPRTHKPQLASALEDIIMTAVAHDPGRRYPSALALATAIERYAAGAGERLGARWIARTMEDVVGARPVPWIAAPTLPDAPSADRSLVDLIAAVADEPGEPTFDDPDEVAAEIEAPRRPDRLPIAPAPRRGRRLAAGLFALGVIGAAATALVLTRGAPPAAIAPPPPAVIASPAAPIDPAPELAGSSAAAVTRGPAAAAESSAAVTATPDPTTSTAAHRAPDAPAIAAQPGAASPVIAPPPAAAPAIVPARAAPVAAALRDAPVRAAPVRAVPSSKRKHRPAATRPARRGDDARAATREPPASRELAPETAAAPPPAPPPAAPPPATPPASATKVEWKPTLLLPTDGADARTKR